MIDRDALVEIINRVKLCYLLTDSYLNKDSHGNEDKRIEDFINDLLKIREHLSKDIIKKINIIFSNPLLINSIKNFKKVLTFKDYNEYLLSIKKLSKEEILDSLIENSLKRNFSNDDFKEEKNQIKNNLDSFKVVELIEDLSKDDEINWIILKYFKNPENLKRDYLEILTSTSSHFDSLFKKYNNFKSLNFSEVEIDETLKIIEKVSGLDSISKFIKDKTKCNNKIYIPTFGTDLLFYNYDEEEITLFEIGILIREMTNMVKESEKDLLKNRVSAFKSLGDEKRYEVLKLIASGEKSLKKIATELSISSATVSYHIQSLVDSGIVKIDFADKTLIKPVNIEKLRDIFHETILDLTSLK